jgi:hypothetical protein
VFVNPSCLCTLPCRMLQLASGTASPTATSGVLEDDELCTLSNKTRVRAKRTKKSEEVVM